MQRSITLAPCRFTIADQAGNDDAGVIAMVIRPAASSILP
jgi:hypothetical protein